MSGVLSLEIDTRRFEQVESDLAVVGCYADERPLRHDVGRVDWRLCALLSELLEAGRVHGEPDEAVLIPTAGRLASRRILMVGLGEKKALRAPMAAALTRSALSRGIALGAESLVLAPFGVAPDDFPRHADLVVGSAAEAVQQHGAVLRLVLAVPESEETRVALALVAAADHLLGAELEIRLPSSAAARPLHAARATRNPPGESGSRPAQSQRY